MMTPAQQSVIYIVDDDDAMRDSLVFLLQPRGLRVVAYASAEAFLSEYKPLALAPSCIVTMPGKRPRPPRPPPADRRRGATPGATHRARTRSDGPRDRRQVEQTDRRPTRHQHQNRRSPPRARDGEDGRKFGGGVGAVRNGSAEGLNRAVRAFTCRGLRYWWRATIKNAT